MNPCSRVRRDFAAEGVAQMPDAGPASRPLVTVIVTTYNRARLVARAVKSVLAQTYPNIDCLVVDDGSTDDTTAVLQTFTDPRLRIIRHERNRGSKAAKNTGLDSIRGEWFSFVDSDDEIVPEAIAALLRVPETVDPAIDKIECNAMDAESGELTGKGLDHDQYLDLKTSLTSRTGDFWGITKTGLVGTDRFREELTGHETLLWDKIRRRSREYYLHRGLLLTHRGGSDRITTSRRDMQKTAEEFRHLLSESEYLENYRTYRPGDYPGFCLRGMIFCLAERDRESAGRYRRLLAAARPGLKQRLVAQLAWSAGIRGVRSGLSLYRRIKQQAVE